MIRHVLMIFCVTFACVGRAAASPGVPDYDFQWRTVGDPRNPAYAGGAFGELAGRGSVSYSYRMSALEISSAQWLEFINIFAPQATHPDQFLQPSISGLLPTATVGVYELNPKIPNAGMVPVYGISWREAAMYCNWLHNGKSHQWSAIMNGAYDASTFGSVPGRPGAFTDQVTRSPDAKFWIPSLDEWIKGAHYDPNRYGSGRGGWWQYPYQSDKPPIPGWPAEGQTSAGLPLSPSTLEALLIPLGSYPDAHSAYGLLDLSGGASEWTEETDPGKFHYERGTKGSYSGASGFTLDWDQIWQIDYPSIFGTGFTGLRVASAVPAPATLAPLIFALIGNTRRTRRSHP